MFTDACTPYNPPHHPTNFPCTVVLYTQGIRAPGPACHTQPGVYIQLNLCNAVPISSHIQDM